METTEAVGTEPTQTTASESTEFDISQYVESTGSFKDGWKDGLVPEDVRGEKVFDTIKDVKSLAKLAGNQAKLVGKKGVIVPTDKSSPEEIAAFRKAIGVPDKPDGYKLETPPELASQVDQNVLAAAKNLFAQEGFTPKQAQSVYSLYNKIVMDGMKQLEAQEATEAFEAEKMIREESGTNYDVRLHEANRCISENTAGWAKEKKDKFLEAINKPTIKPYIMDMFANIQSKYFSEHKIADGGDNAVSAGLQQKVDELRQDKAYLDIANPRHRALVNEVYKLQEQISASKQG